MELEHSYTAGRCESKYNHLGNLAISTEDEHTHTHTHQPAVSFLRIYPTEMQTHVYQMTCRTFIVTLFTRVSKWKQPKCLPIEKKDRMWYTYTMKYNSYGNEKKTPIKFSKMNKSHNTEYEKPEIYI